jgi:hypothetical protein
MGGYEGKQKPKPASTTHSNRRIQKHQPNTAKKRFAGALVEPNFGENGNLSATFYFDAGALSASLFFS